MALLSVGDKAPAFSLKDQDGRILQASYKVKPEDTVPNARKALA